MSEIDVEKKEGTLGIGIIDWAFGCKRTGQKNNCGVIIDKLSFRELFFLIDHVEKTSSLWESYKKDGRASRVQDVYVVYEEFETYRSDSGYGAKHVRLLDEVSTDFLKKNLKTEVKNNLLVKNLLLKTRPDVYLDNSIMSYLPFMQNQTVQKVFNEKLQSGVFKENISKALKKYFDLKKTDTWPASNWKLFDFSKEPDKDLIQMYLSARKKGFDVKPLYSLIPQIWIGNRDIIGDVPFADIKKYYSKNYIYSDHFILLMEVLDDEGKEWIARKVDPKWLLKSPEYCQYLTEDAIIRFISSLDPTECKDSVRKKAESVFGVIDPLNVHNAAEELIRFAATAKDEKWTSLLPDWAVDPSKMPVIEDDQGEHEEKTEDKKKEDPFIDDPDFVEYYQRYHFNRQLSDDQRRAIQAIDGVYLLFAIPGSGKTTVIINRLAYMVYGKKDGIKPESILCMTFGGAAAKHMQDEYIQLIRSMQVQENYGIPRFDTIHSICREIVWNHMGKDNITLIKDNSETPYEIRPKTILKGIIKEWLLSNIQNTAELPSAVEEENLFLCAEQASTIKIVSTPVDSVVSPASFNKKYRSEEELSDLTEKISNAISFINNRCLYNDEEKAKQIKIDNDGEIIEVAPFYHAYMGYLEKNRLMDHDRSLRLALDILTSNRPMLDSIRNQYKYICVDEAQDVSTIQYKIFRMMVGEEGNLFMVGDDDQSIYGFTGANPGEMLGFRELFPNGIQLEMGTNYRSSPEIVDSAHSFIKHSLKRKDKSMIASKSERAKIESSSFTDMLSELDHIAFEAKRFADALPEDVESGKKLQQLAILYRKNISALPVMAALLHYRVPFSADAGKLENTFIRFRTRSDSKNLIGLLRLSQDITNMNILTQCYTALGLFLTKDQRDEAASHHCRGNSVFIALRGLYKAEEDAKKIEVLNSRERVLRSIKDKKPYDAVCELINRFEFAEKIKGTSQWFSIYTLLSMAYYSSSIKSLLDEIDNLGKNHIKGDAVVLSTMHSSKGQQYRKVIIVDPIEDFIPGNARIGEDYSYDPEEERRIFYVALTRAEAELDIYYVKKYFGHCYPSSRFVYDYVQGNCAVKVIERAIGQFQNLITTPERTYYAVLEGESAGIYPTEKIAKEKGSYRSFRSKQEADEYLYRCPTNLSTKRIRDIVGKSVDIPQDVRNNILSLFAIHSLGELFVGILSKIRRKTRYMFSGNKEPVDYSDRAKEYALLYLPVNYYKIWTPLLEAARRRKLPVKSNPINRIQILEVGAGPGTSTLSVLEFYYQLAEENNMDIYLDLTIVEYEKAFINVLDRLLNSCFGIADAYGERRKGRLHCRIKCNNKDAISYLHNTGLSYNLIYESNMLNGWEHINRDDISQLASDISKSMVNFGLTILVEPADNRIDMLKDLSYRIEFSPGMSVICSDERDSTNLENIQLYCDVVDYGLITKKQKVHKFRYAIYEKG